MIINNPTLYKINKDWINLIKFTFIHPHAHHIFLPPIRMDHLQFKGRKLWITLKWI